MKRPDINNYPKKKDGKQQYYHDDIEKYIDYLESENKKLNLKDLLFDYEVESCKPYPYHDDMVNKKISNYLKSKP